VSPDLQDEMPEAYTFLNNFYWSPDDMGEVMVMIEDGMEPFDAARAWIAENRATVESWLP
jgi:glycine betaine/proline transport system substrate-binding protein